MEEAKTTPKKSGPTRAWKGLTILIALLILYTVYHVMYGIADNVDTTPAGLVEQRTSVVLEGVIFREEEGITTKNKGDMRPYYYDGERVSVDAAVASVYTKSVNTDLNAKIAELEEKLDILKQSNVSGLVSVVDIEKIKADVDTLYSTMMLAVSTGDLLRASRAEKEMLIAMNKLAIYEGKVKNYNDDISKIENELDTLYDSFVGEREYIFADKGGYFYHSLDGYEDILTQDVLASLTAEKLDELIASVKKTPTRESSYTAKFVYNNVWSIAVLCDRGSASLLEEGKIYNAVLFDVRERELDLKLQSIKDNGGESVVLVFTCSDMPEGFDFTRYQEFRLDISSIEGYRVPKEALVTVTDKTTGEEKIGVYTVNASVVSFKRVEIIGESEGYYVVAKYDRSKDNYREYLNINDLIVLDVKGMYDGKTLKR